MSLLHRPLRRPLAPLAAMLVAGALVLIQPAAHAETLRERADRILFSTSLASFTTQSKANAVPDVDAGDPLVWANDGCSNDVFDGFDDYDTVFRWACVRHDFGYRNLGNGPALTSTEAGKAAVDSQFLEDMRTICAGRPSDGNCGLWARTYYTAVHATGAAWTAFYRGQCQSGRLCLFEDDAYGDRRLRITAATTSIADLEQSASLPEPVKDFGDEADSVRNTTSYAYRLYADSGNAGRSVCVAAGASISSLDDRGIGDAVSSVRRVSAC